MKQIEVWVLTTEYNEYNQEGEYLEKIWAYKPDLQELIDATQRWTKSNDVHTLLKAMLQLSDGKLEIGNQLTINLNCIKLDCEKK